jgi:hypothetical protein
MSRTMKWVLGIIAVLVVLAVLAGAVWVWQNRGVMMAGYGPFTAQPNGQTTPGGPNVPNGQRGFGFGNNGRNPMFGYGFRGPMMGRGMGRVMRYGPFGLGFLFFGGLLRLIVPLILLVLVAVLFYQLGKRSVVRREPVPTTPPPAEQNPPQS